MPNDVRFGIALRAARRALEMGSPTKAPVSELSESQMTASTVIFVPSRVAGDNHVVSDLDKAREKSSDNSTVIMMIFMMIFCKCYNQVAELSGTYATIQGLFAKGAVVAVIEEITDATECFAP
ncbi:hypothetical protein HPB48_013016 [Haemaphysalis longicornis]|uniref:Uncharacterized protein n=1 Tax=Haemaphysalis longicornis TaxID=44386 RepID=A0A9J6GWU3_HAELO|nr:hypothetical protein HPB48_013016 [Haemaphysalis longicornis]